MAEEYSSPLELISKSACIDFIKKIYKNENQRHLLIEKDEKSLSLIQYAAIYDRADIIRQLCSLFNEQSHELLPFLLPQYQSLLYLLLQLDWWFLFLWS